MNGKRQFYFPRPRSSRRSIRREKKPLAVSALIFLQTSNKNMISYKQTHEANVAVSRISLTFIRATRYTYKHTRTHTYNTGIYTRVHARYVSFRKHIKCTQEHHMYPWRSIRGGECCEIVGIWNRADLPTKIPGMLYYCRRISIKTMAVDFLLFGCCATFLGRTLREPLRTSSRTARSEGRSAEVFLRCPSRPSTSNRVYGLR